MFPRFQGLAAATLAALLSAGAMAQTDLPAGQFIALKAKLAQRMPGLLIESARTTPMSGLIEVKVGDAVAYTDPNGDYLIEGGQLTDTKTKRNLTEERLDEINKVDFASLPFKDAVVWKQGTGKRKLVVFADPHCTYCRQLEKELQQVKDVTVYTFMIAILGEDSRTKLDGIWCQPNHTQAWRDWMLGSVAPSRGMGICLSSSPWERNLKLYERLHFQGTPSMLFEDGTHLSSALPAAAIEQRLSRASAKIGG